MSYGLICKCPECKKKKQCIDSTFIQTAISGIHAVNYANGVIKELPLHLGSGSIEIKCQKFEDENEKPKSPGLTFDE